MAERKKPADNEPLEQANQSTDPARRALLKGAAALGGAAALTPFVSCSDAQATQPMRYRTLGRTGLRVSEVGFGGYPLSDAQVVRHAVDRGINYLDTAHCYRGGSSETVMGEALTEMRSQRDQLVVATKWCPHHIGREPTKESFTYMLDESLRRLKTDYVDIVFNHEVGKSSDGQGIDRLKNPAMHEAFAEARQAGKVRFLGVSGHDPDLMQVLHYAVDSGDFDAVLARYSFLDYPEQNELIAKAKKKGVGFVAMKTLAGAKGADLDRFRDRHTSFKQAALKWVLSNAGVSNLVISINSNKQVDEYADASGKALSGDDKALLEEYEREFSADVCRFCGACEPACPGDVRIADILRFAMYHNEYKQQNRAIESYAKLVTAERAAHCNHCAGMCESACGYDLPIRSLLLDAHKRLA